MRFYVQQDIEEKDNHKMKLYMHRIGDHISDFYAINTDILQYKDNIYLFYDIYGCRDFVFDNADINTIVKESVLLE